MALGRYGRVDNRRSSSSSYGSTVTIVVFVGLCLVGIWMMTSSSVIPDQNEYDVAHEKKNQLDDQVTPVIDNSNDRSNEKKNQLDDQVTPVIDNSNDKSNNVQFEDNPGDLPEDARKGDSNVSRAKDDGKGTGNLSTQENRGNTEDSQLVESKKDKKQLDSEAGQTNNSDGENLAERIGDSNVNRAKDGGTGNFTQENKGNTEESKSDESKKDKKQLDSEGGQTNNNGDENLLKDARIGDSNVSVTKDGGTDNSNTQENKGNTEGSKSDESKKDKKQLDSEGGQTNNSGENLSKEDRKGDSNVSLAKDDGTGNLNTQENKITEESKLDESKKDEKQLDTEGGQINDNSEKLSALGGSEENSVDKKSDPGESNKKAVSNENDKTSDSGSGEKKPDKKSSETTGGKGDGQIEGKIEQNGKNESNKKYSEGGLTNNNSGKNLGGLGDSEANPDDKKSDSKESNKKAVNEKNSNESDSVGTEKKPVENSSGTNGTKVDGQIEGKVDKNDKKLDQSSDEAKDNPQVENQSLNEVSSSVAQSELLSETNIQNGSFSTQVAVSTNEKKTRLASKEYSWKLCNSTAGPDYIPCLDNWEAIRHLRTNKHYEHRERHCPEEPPTCLVPLPQGYKRSITWPKSREKIWYCNIPHTQLAEIKGHQNWVKVTGEYLTFPGGGTQFKHGALLYIDFIEESAPEIAWGKRSRVILDVGCGVASFGGFLFDRNVLAMSLAPKDEHEAQVQFALERGIPAVSAVMGTKKLPYPGRVFDIVHCARCRVPWHIEGGKLLLELNRLLRPGGFFVWSTTPVYQKVREDVEIWKAMVELTEAMCWKLVNKTRKDPINRVAVAIFKKPSSNDCYNRRPKQEPPLCPDSDDPNAAWNVSLKTCMHKVPVDASERGSKWPEPWPARLEKSPYWLLSSHVGVYGKAAPEDFASDSEHWKRVVQSYRKMGINWLSIRNVMDMKAVYGGFAAALKDLDLWVMNVVPIRSPDTLPIIYERGLFGMYHNWCESFSTYPRSYDLLHADHLFCKVKKRCNILSMVAEVDRILRPEGIFIVRDDVETINELESMLRSMQWKVLTTFSKDKQGLLCVQKSMWRPKEVETITYAIA
ncbi:putative methyltransferase PMT27 [Hibiscus syriacus]|uniref:Methyltransferase PMT27 n=1 Tax=Hibiscus syriacus TaxID=106335 RepID=A0A6A2ZSR9_HIBSY|nr:putative methyltransferase PMT27 [Hibiscus syriacus]